MLTTTIVVSLFLGVFVVSVALWVFFLRLGLRWAKAPDVTSLRLAIATCLVFVLQLTLAVASYLYSPPNIGQELPLAFGQLVLAMLIPWVVLSKVFRLPFWRAAQAWLPTLIMPVVMIAFSFLVFRAFLVEAFIMPTNAMAPTLLGRHWEGVCPECGSSAYSSLDLRHDPTDDLPLMICRENFHVTRPIERRERVLPADRFLVTKFLKPRRWDIIVFRYPEEPSLLYAQRLVGLPGELIEIKDGCVWANGQKLTPPDSIRGIEYASEEPVFRQELWGSSNSPADLRDDEYFMLGDFSKQSNDSRHWRRGEPTHQPFAVPASHLKGVVTHIYWPPSRWRAFR